MLGTGDIQGVADHLAEADRAGHLADRGHRRPTLEHGLLRRPRDVVEVVVDPDRVEAEVLGLRGDSRHGRPMIGPGPILAPTRP